MAARGDKEKNKPGCFLQTTHWPLSRRDMRVHTSWNCLQSAGVGAGAGSCLLEQTGYLQEGRNGESLRPRSGKTREAPSGPFLSF